MNVRKPVDYGVMYRKLTAILAQKSSADGRNLCHRQGHQPASREGRSGRSRRVFLQANFPDCTGFSPRATCAGCATFYRTYENDQTLLQLAMKIGWTLNVVIMEAELTRDAHKWYLEQAQKQQWSKATLLEKLTSAAHLEKSLDIEADTCYTGNEDIMFGVRQELNINILWRCHRWIKSCCVFSLWRCMLTSIDTMCKLKDVLCAMLV